MRATKFRGKRVDTGEWVEGHLVDDNHIGDIEHPVYNSSAMGCGVEDRCITDRYEACEHGYESAYEYIFQNVHEVDPETVGQFTGLMDSEEAEIYEGDIVQFAYWWFDGNEAESLLTGAIVYSGDRMSYQLKGVMNAEWEKHTGHNGDTEYLTAFSELAFCESDFYVIGNIHDNLELLEATK
jgi:uncharacterized phage protein (TIGR01671 family)